MAFLSCRQRSDLVWWQHHSRILPLCPRLSSPLMQEGKYVCSQRQPSALSAAPLPAPRRRRRGRRAGPGTPDDRRRPRGGLPDGRRRAAARRHRARSPLGPLAVHRRRARVRGPHRRAPAVVAAREALAAEAAKLRVAAASTERLASVGRMAAGLAHEIRNPLVSIRTFTQLLPERHADEEFRNGFLDLTLAEIDRISALVGEILSYARPDNAEGRDADEPSAIDVGEASRGPACCCAAMRAAPACPSSSTATSSSSAPRSTRTS